MSIFNKVLILFLISLFLMIFMSNETNKLTQNQIETLLKEKYIQVSDELFTYLSDDNKNALNKKLKELDFRVIEDKQHYFDSSQIIYKYTTTLSAINILRHEDNKYMLYMKYLDDDILVMDYSQEKDFAKKEFLNYMVIADILILIILFLIILKMIYPLKEMSKSIKKFGDGDYNTRVKDYGDDEIGELSKSFNLMASNTQELITSRQQLLRDISHELKTPISKSKLAIEMIEESKYKNILSKALSQMDDMTSELLYIEKLNANQYKFDMQKFTPETLISEALSKLFIEDEEFISVKIESSFEIEADLNYLSIALKNLIDNALKYTTKLPVIIEVKDKSIYIKNIGEKLEKPLKYYCELFTQGDNSRGEKGYGIGLSLVKRVLDKHGFEFLYSYENGYNNFHIYFIKTLIK